MQQWGEAPVLQGFRGALVNCWDRGRWRGGAASSPAALAAGKAEDLRDNAPLDVLNTLSAQSGCLETYTAAELIWAGAGGTGPLAHIRARVPVLNLKLFKLQ